MKAYRGRLILFLLLLVGLGLARSYRGALTPEAASAWLGRWGFWAPFVFVGIYSLAPAFFFPGSALTLAAGALFGPLWGAFLSLVGATAGATVAFLVARYLASGWVERRVSGRLQDLKGGIEREGWRFVAFVRLLPLFPFNLLNYALGLTRISLSAYVVASFLAMAPGALAYACLGHLGREVVEGGSNLVPKGLLALSLLAALLLLPSLVRRWQHSQRLTAQKLHTQLSGEQPPLILDVRSPEKFARGHIPGALSLPLPDLERGLGEPWLSPTWTLVVV